MKKIVFLCIALTTLVLNVSSAFGYEGATTLNLSVSGERGIVEIYVRATFLYTYNRNGTAIGGGYITIKNDKGATILVGNYGEKGVTLTVPYDTTDVTTISDPNIIFYATAYSFLDPVQYVVQKSYSITTDNAFRLSASPLVWSSEEQTQVVINYDCPLSDQYGLFRMLSEAGGTLLYEQLYMSGQVGSLVVDVNSYFLRPGAHTVTLLGNVINKPISSTSELDIMVKGPNVAPVAEAGADQTVHVGEIVTLDGGASSDPDGNVPLTYEWTFVSWPPQGGMPILSDSTIVNPQFTDVLPGNYEIQLVVTDSLGAASVPDTVIISTINTAPVAHAGDDESVSLIGATEDLDGSQSYDDDGDPITYQWTFVSVPAGSTTSLNGADTATSTFVVDVHGDYEVQLVVSDPWTQSTPDTVMVSFNNIKPVAFAGTSQTVVLGNTATLDGSGSFDANGDYLTYSWTLSSTPVGSLALITDPTAEITSFIPDLAGTYIAQLIVNDYYEYSDPSTKQVLAITQQTAVIESVQVIETVIESLGSAPELPLEDILKNTNMQNTLLNKLNAAIANIVDGNYADALGQLQNDILGKTDGCAESGSPDKNDWVRDCGSQSLIYQAVLDAIGLVEGLL